MDQKKLRTWAEIDLGALEHNYRVLRKEIPYTCRFLGLCKADAYGHGAVEVGLKLQELGADMLAVACLDEGLELRKHGITIPILCLGETPVEAAQLLVEQDMIQMVGDLMYGKALSEISQKIGKPVVIHIKIDTGMGRLGFLWDEAHKTQTLQALEELCHLEGIYAQGVFTHFSCADCDEAFTTLQLERFQQVKEELEKKKIYLSNYHCAASAATLSYPQTHMDMVRPGIALYGYDPTGQENHLLKPVMTVKSRITTVRTVPEGWSVSYGGTVKLKNETKLAVIPIGYGDGYPRILSNRTTMLVRDIPCPVVGRICMDMCMIDVSQVPDVQEGEQVTVYNGALIQEAAQKTDTIVYEILCSVGKRVPRVYVSSVSK